MKKAEIAIGIEMTYPSISLHHSQLTCDGSVEAIEGKLN
jgi:hypothetical protein